MRLAILHSGQHLDRSMLLTLNLDLNIQVFEPGNTLLSCPILSLSLNDPCIIFLFTNQTNLLHTAACFPFFNIIVAYLSAMITHCCAGVHLFWWCNKNIWLQKSVDFTHLAVPSLHIGLSSKHGLVKVFTLLILSCNITHRSFSRQGLVPFVLLNLKW